MKIEKVKIEIIDNNMNISNIEVRNIAITQVEELEIYKIGKIDYNPNTSPSTKYNYRIRSGKDEN